MTNLLMLTALTVTHAQDRTIDISGDNTDKTATQYATPLTINEGETQVVRLTQAIDPEWNARRLHVVAFVWNDKGVQQAVKQIIN